ncbi:carbohydrate-binding protein [Mesorhizobium sp. VNQ89]|uniref:carbohydrate-binding protein n=1 Tax=Mesorhizobium quangtriensis TaxID=3157709 RepID=UPI0032B7C670
MHDLLVSFANGWKQSRSAILQIDGVPKDKVKFEPTGSWANWQTKLLHLELPAGDVKISIVNTNRSGPEIASVHLDTHVFPGKGLAIGDDALAAMGTAGIAALALALNLDAVQSGTAPSGPKGTQAIPEEVAAAGLGQDAAEVDAPPGAPVVPDDSEEPDGDFHLHGSSSPILMRADVLAQPMTFAKIATAEISNLDIEPQPEGIAFSSAASFEALAAGDEEEGFQTMRLEAETAVRGNSGGTQSTTPNLVIAGTPGIPVNDEANAQAASGDAYVDFAGIGTNFNIGSGEFIEWTFEVPEAGVYDLAFGYAFNSGTTVDRPMNLKVNGQLWDRLFEMPATASNTTYSEALTRVTLQEGVNTVRLTTTGYSGANLDYLEVRAADPGRIVIQAESLLPTADAATMDPTVNRAITIPYLMAEPAVEQFRGGAEGDSYLDWGSNANITNLPVTATIAGTYAVVVTYANGGNAPRNIQLLGADNSLKGTFNFAQLPTAQIPAAYFDDYLDIPARIRPNDSANDADTHPDPTGWESWRKETLSAAGNPVTIRLEAGANIFKLSGTAGPNIDKIEFVLVDPDNRAPVAQDFDAAATEDTAIVIDVAAHLDDPDNDALTIVAASVPASQGTVSFSGTLITFTPAANFHGEATISYTVADPSLLQDTAEITVSVASVNDAPESLTVTGALGLPEDATAGTVVGAVSALDPDAGDTLTYSVDDSRFTINASGEIVVASDAAFDSTTEPTITILVTATDAAGLSTSEEAVITVGFVNSAPEAEDFAAETDEDTAITINVLDYINDPDGDALTVTATVPAAQGTVSVNGTEITFTPALNFHGDATITYTVTDTGTLAADGTISVSVAPENDAPTISGSLSDATVPAEGGSLALSSLIVSDVDGDATTLGIRLAGGGSLPAGIGISGGSVTVDASVAAGNYEIEIFANDGSVDSSPVAFTLTKSAPPPPFSPFVLQAENFTIVPDSDAVATNDSLARTRANVASHETVDPSLLDPFGLRPGYTGEGYLDINGTLTTPRATFQLDAPAGTYEIHLRLANGATGTGAGFNRPVAVAVDGIQQGASQNTNTGGFDIWQIRSFVVTLTGNGPHTIGIIQSATAGAPNIDAVAITEPGGSPSFFLPVFTSEATATFAENGVGTVLDVNATDGDGTALVYGLSGNGPDDVLFDIDPTTGVLTFKASPDFETGGDNSYSVEVTVTDGTSTVTQAVSVTVSDVNEAPTSVTADGVLSLAEDAAPGTVVGNVSGVDPDAGDSLTFTVDDARFTVNANGEIVVADGAAFDFEAESSIPLVITATDEGGLTKTLNVSLAVTDVNEQVLPFNVTFSLAGITSYSPQDVGTGLSVGDEGATLNLGGNLWKRASLGESYTITENTKLTFTYTIGSALPEIVAVGFDDDNSPFETADKSVYQIAGTENQPAFVDLRNGVVGAPGTTVTITIDLAAHAGKTISSLVFIADDDSPSNGIGSASFTNVQLSETPVEVENAAPIIVGGGIADLVADERSSLELDLPFVDPDGDTLTYVLTVTDSLGNPVAGFEGLSVEGGVLVGQINAAPSTIPYTVTIVANDGNGGETSLSFDLTVENVNEAPEVDAGVAFEPHFGKVGTEIDGIDLNLFKDAFSDPDGDALTFSVEGLPEGLSLNSEGVIVGTPTGTGTGSFTIVATDPDGLRAELEIQLDIEEAGVGDVTIVQAEQFTGLGSATNFFVAATPGASNNQVIRTDANEAGSIATALAQNGLTEGWYTVTITVYDETDGNATFSLKIGDTQLATNKSFADGTFDNSLPRGNAGQAGNLKTISFETPVFVDASTIALLTGQADAGENLRIDKLTFTRTASPELPPSAIVLAPAAIDENIAAGVIGTLSATDPDGEESGLVYSTTDARFTIVGNQLRLADGVSLDHEAGETVTVAVTVTDAQGLSTTTDVTITVGDVNEAPALAPTAAIADVTLTEGEAQSIDLAAALGATDPDAGDAVTYEATLAGGGALPAGITLVGSSLQIANTLAVGTYEITVLATDGVLDSDSVSFAVTIEEEGDPEPFLLTIQAEDGLLTVLDNDADTNDTTVRDPDNQEGGTNPQLVNGLRPGFTGTGYVDFGNFPGDNVAYTFAVPTAGTYEIQVRYATNLARPLAFAVNDVAQPNLPFVPTGTNVAGPDEGFNNWSIQTVSVQLQAGSNTIAFALPAGATGGPNLDSITIIGEGTAPDTSADADDQPLFLSGPDGPLSGAAKDSINFQLSGIDSDIVKVELSFDGGATRVEVFPDADGDFTVDGSALTAGNYTVTTYVTDDAGNVATEAMDIVVAGTVVDVPTFTIQAEDTTKVTVQDTGTGNADATLTRVVTAANPDATGNFRPGSVGEAYMDFGGNAGDAITINVDAPEAGTYLVTFRYANGGTADRPLDLSLNGGAATSVSFVPGASSGTPASPWNTWLDKTVELTLVEGTNTIKLTIPTGAVAGPNIDQITFDFQDGAENPVEPFSVTIEGETFTTFDPEAVDDTVARTPTNPEPGATPATSGPGLEFDANGLRPGHEGTGYMDMGNDIGDSASFTIDAPEAGTYQLTVRYANGGATDRPMTLSVGGVTQTLAFASTAPAGSTAAVAWQTWAEFTIDIELDAGTNSISFTNTIANGPNIDNVTISREGTDPVDTREQIRFEEVVKINFQPPAGQTTQGLPAGFQTPAGYLADVGLAYGDRGNGFSYGWVTEASVADGTANGTIAAAQPANAHWYKNIATGASDLQKTYAHFEYPGGGVSRAWEMGLENGTYQVTISVGDTAGAFDSLYAINVEGQEFLPDWIPANPIDGTTTGGGFRSTLVTRTVTVTDGRLTIDSIGGTNTEIQYLEIEKIEDLTPGDGRTADLDYSYFVAPVADSLDGQVSIALGPNGELPVDIDPTSMFVIGVNVQAEGNRGPNITHTENIKLVETLTGIEVEIDVQISGGADSLTIRPVTALKENTSYTLKVQDVLDLGSITDPDAPLRQMQDLTTTFVTGEAPEDVAREVAFSTSVQLNGFADGAGGYTSIEFGPDGKLYVATITGEIHRWNVNSDGTIDKASQETVALDYLDAGGGERRGIVGFVFDPNDPNTIWITDNAPIPREQKAFDTPEFSGRVSKVTLGPGGSLEDATAETYIRGLPRSGADHLSNSLEFRENPDFGQAGEPEYLLYMSQGSNSAAGAPDGAWGNRPERLLNAAILEIDPTKTPPAGGFNVQTEPLTNNSPTTQNPASAFNADGTYPGFYNPYAEDAVLTIYATGVRNAYDLVWHSNGHLYVPTNGTASGGKTPNDPTQPGLDTVIANSPKQYDYFFTVDEGGYYGHPNVLHDQYILNGGNPTSGLDPNEVVGGNDGNSATDGYQVGVDPDPDYDLDGVYNLGYNRSPNGAIEYTGNAFGSNLKGAILFAQFSTGDNVRMIRVDSNGNIIGDDVLRRPDGSVINNYIDPLDIIQNPVTGQLYLMTLNRSTGASQLILLTPAPGGITEDVTANEGGDLALVAFDVSDPAAAVFQINGLDDDITAVRVRFNNGPETTVTLNAQDRFTIDIGSLSGTVTATIRVTDDDLNEASVSTSFTPGVEPEQPEFVTLMTIQAEDKTPADGTAVTVPTSAAAQIQIRDASNTEANTGAGYVNGLRPGAIGLDGNTDNLDGTPGGYADFGSTNADFLTFTFTVPSDDAGTAILRFRYANGSTVDRPLQLEVNGTIIKVQSFVPTTPAGGTVDGWTVWSTVEIPVSLVAGQNTVTLRAVNATGPNIDQLEILVPSEPDTTTPNDGETVINGVTYVLYEAENAASTGSPAIVSEDRNQSGDFVDFLGPDTETLTWTVEVSAAGVYGVDILYALGTNKAARPMGLSVNGTPVETLPFVPNSPEAENVWGAQQTTLLLNAGVNTITISAPGGVAPNIDLLRITKSPLAEFEPDYVQIDGSGRIELEAQDGSAHIVNGSTVEFYFTVDDNGVYKLDAAANANAANGQGLTWFLNGVEIDETDFPGIGLAGEESVYLTLTAGTQYQIKIVSDAPGAAGIDYLDVSPAPGNPNADIGIQSLDPAYLDNRLHFSFLEDPDAVAPDDADRDFKDSGTVRISNTGTEPLTFTETELTGPFVLANPAIFTGLTLAPGAFIDVTVLFNRAAYTPPTSNVNGTSTIFSGELTIVTNDADDPVTTIDLRGFWQARDEGGQEPNVNEIWRIFGFGNVIENLTLIGGGENSALSTNDVFAKTDPTEVLSPYWTLADGVTSAKVTQIAAFHGTGGATLAIHNPNNKGAQVTFWNHEGTDNQRLLPNAGNDTTFATRTFGNSDIPDGWAGNEVFGISVAGLSTDPRLNPTGDVIVPGAQQGHTVKMFQALDEDGNVIPNVYLGIMDYTGINYDYNDNLFVIEGVKPVGFGQDLRLAGLDDAAADERLVFTSIDNPANAQQSFRNEAVLTIANDGFAALNISSIVLGDTANFQIVGAISTTVAAGGSAQITVRYIGTHAGTTAGAQLHTSTLTINSDDYAEGVKVVQLAGLAQEFSENGSEPTVEQIVEAFGYGTDMAQGELASGGAVETIGDEVLMPYMQRLDNTQAVQVIQMAAFLQQNNVARLGFHGLNSSTVTNLFAQDDQDYQTVSPNPHVAGSGAGAGVARGTINQSTPFGLYISVDGRPTYASWSDPEANEIDPNFGSLVDNNEGHLIRFFQALDAQGNVIEGTYIGIQDYPGAGNYDYNDHMFVIKNVKPYELTAANDANNDDINDALQNDADGDGTVNFFDPNSNPPGGGNDRGAFVVGVNFGGGAIANDPVLGVPLLAQTNSRVTITGSVTASAGTDVASNPNGANAVAGSAFKTYEDGTNWTAAITVPNGTYVVVLHTQETYWNSPGMRQFDVSVNGQQVINNLDPFVAAGGGDKPLAFEALVTVTDGKITINATADIDNAALNAVTIYEYDAPSTGDGQEPFNGTAFVVDADGVTIDASLYDEGGQGVAYNDAAGLQGGTNGGRAGSSVESTSSGDIGWIAGGEWLEYTIDVDTAGAHNLSLLLANADGAGRSAVVSFYRPGESTPYATSASIANPQTASWSTFVSRSGGTINLEEGEQIVRVTFNGGSQDFRSFNITPVVAPVTQTPFGGTAPGFTNGTLNVDATNFDNGGQGVAYNDNPGLDGGNTTVRPGRAVEFVGAGNDIGYVKPGEWVEYTINVPTTGIYTFSANAKTPVAGATIAVSLNGTTALGTVTLADGHAGGSNFDSAAFAQSQAISLSLAAGVQTLRLTFNGPLAANGYVLDLASFTLQAQVPQTPFGGTAPVLDADGLTIDGIDYDNGGQGVAYNDAAGLQGGTNGGRTGSAVEVTSGGNIGWIASGEWLEYTINVTEAGPYSFNLSMSLGDATGPNRSVTATFTTGSNVETVTVNTPRTGTWTNFQDTQDATVDLPAGITVVRLTFNGGSQDLESFTLEPAASALMASAFAAPQSEGPEALFVNLSEDLFADLPDYADDTPDDAGTPPPQDPIQGYDLVM